MAGVEFVPERDSVSYRRPLHLVPSVLSCDDNIEPPSLEWGDVALIIQPRRSSRRSGNTRTLTSYTFSRLCYSYYDPNLAQGLPQAIRLHASRCLELTKYRPYDGNTCLLVNTSHDTCHECRLQ